MPGTAFPGAVGQASEYNASKRLRVFSAHEETVMKWRRNWWQLATGVFPPKTANRGRPIKT